MTTTTARRRMVVPIEDIVCFGEAMIESRDIDPIYPILGSLQRQKGLVDEQEEAGLWLTVLYVAFYNLPSALTAFRQIDWPVCRTESPGVIGSFPTDVLSRLPIGTERRGLRGGTVVEHLVDYWIHVYWRWREDGRPSGGPSQRRWMQHGWEDAPPTPEWRYSLFWDTWQQVRYNGRWSAFKTAEILSTVHGFPMAAPDMRMAHCSGPREGLIWLYDLDLRGYRARDCVSVLDEHGLHLRRQLADRGLPLSWEQLETVLCNFNSMRQGKYYVGHDIDELQGQIGSAEHLHSDDRAMLLAARHSMIPERYLGECGGWSGVQHDRQRAYVDQRRILTR